MKKIFALILSIVLVMFALTACDLNQKDVGKNTTYPSCNVPSERPTEDNQDSTDQIINDDGTINYNFEYFQATGEVYREGSLIDAFPLLNADDSFWSLTTFAVYPKAHFAIDGHEPGEVVDDMTWEEVKGLPMCDLDDVITARGYLPSMYFRLLAEPGDRTVKEIIEDRDWYGNGWLTMQKQMDIFFPESAGSIAEMIVKNYGQPSAVDFYGGRCDIEYYVGNRSITMNIGENIQQDDDELPYTIQVFLRMHEAN